MKVGRGGGAGGSRHGVTTQQSALVVTSMVARFYTISWGTMPEHMRAWIVVTLATLPDREINNFKTSLEF